MKRVDFFKLSREKQERFMASAKGSAPPAPIVHVYGDGGLSRRWAILSGACALAIVLLYVVRFGSLGASLAVHGMKTLAVYLALFFVVPFAALRALGSLRAAKVLPYTPGIYVFPMCLVDARTKTLRIHAMTDVAHVGEASAGGELRLSFRGGGSFRFPARDAHEAEMLNRGVANAQEQVKHALATSDDSELTTLDPFYDAKRGWTSPIGPKDPLMDRSPAWRKLDWVFAVGCAIVLGPVLWLVHNRLSDDVMLRKATTDGSPEAFRAYLSVGMRHHDEVAATLLPRAELAIARSQQTVEAIQAFLGSHPGSAIDAEAQAALREALLRELDKAKKIGSLAALQTFDTRYPAHHLAPELAAARHELYVAAVGRFKTLAATDDPALLAFVSRLAKWLELHGPGVAMTFHRELSPALAQADKLIGQAPTNRLLGPKQVTKYLEPNDTQPKESVVAAALARAMRRAFSPDLLEVRFASDDPDTLAPKQPVVAVRYRYGWLGVAYASIPLRRAFAGLHVSGESVFELPDQGSPVRTRLDIPPAPKLPLNYTGVHEGLSAPQVDDANPEQGVYFAQEIRSLDQVAGQIENTFFKSR